MLRTVTAALIISPLLFSVTFSDDFSYAAIAKRYDETQLDPQTVKDARMQGECLVGLKQLNFQKRDDFDPVAEWTNYRSLSLLEKFPPCSVLIMIEVAREELIEEEQAQ